MEFTLLGPVTARKDGQLLPLGGQQRAVLAVLLFSAGSVVSRKKIVELAWGPGPDDAPPTASALVTDYVSRLRATFKNAGVGAEAQLIAHEPGYLIDVADDAVDWHRFRAVLERGLAAREAEDLDEAAQALSAALELWQGPALADLAPALDPLRRLMEERRLVAAEACAAVELARGWPERAVAVLADPAELYPVRERLVALLIQALGAAGRRDEAVAAYLRSRRRLREELGLDPTPVLKEAFQAVLAGPSTVGPPAPRSVAPAQLPLDTPTFTGRVAELQLLLALVPGDPPPAAPSGTVCVVNGMPGVGKTALAVHAARRLAERFPDGQLFLDLHGHTKGAQRVEPAEALDRLLRAVGVPGAKIPHHLDDRAALYRDRLAGRRMLILLDNAYSAEQVRPLLPAAPGCLVLVTSRRRLTSLDDALPLTLETLPAADAVALFGRVAGAERVSGQNEVVERIAGLCGGLPLALRIAAAPLRTHPTRRPSHVADALADAHEALSELDDGERSIAAAFRLSYEDLTAEQAGMFRLLALVPGRDVDAYAAAALADVPLSRAIRLLHDLVDAHLLDQRSEGRYHFHDLMRLYATNRANRQESRSDRRAALVRLLDHQLHTAAAAVDSLYPHERDRRPPVGAAGTPMPPVADPVNARAWLDAERTNLIAAAGYAAGHGWPDHTWRLDAVLHGYLISGAHYAAALELARCALPAARDQHDRAAEATILDHLGQTYRYLGCYREALYQFRSSLAARRETGDLAGEAAALTNLGTVLGLHGRYQPALEHLYRALDLHRQVGSTAREARTLTNLGNVHVFAGDYDRAAEHYEEARRLCAQIGNRAGEGYALINIGEVYERRGQYDKALEHYRRAVTICAEVGDRVGEGAALTNLGSVYQQRGRFDLARMHHQQALDLFRAIRHRPGQGETLSRLGSTYAALRKFDHALEHFERALTVAQEMGDRTLETVVANALGATLREMGRPDSALAAHQQALAIAQRIGNQHEQARALEGIGELRYGAADEAGAYRHFSEALAIYTKLGAAEAGRLRRWLQQSPSAT